MNAYNFFCVLICSSIQSIQAITPQNATGWQDRKAGFEGLFDASCNRLSELLNLIGFQILFFKMSKTSLTSHDCDGIK